MKRAIAWMMALMLKFAQGAFAATSYPLHFTHAIFICRHSLSLQEKAPPDIESLISRELLPVRPGRSDPRKVKFQSAVSFLYRVA